MLTKFLNNIAFRKALIELCKQNTQFEQVKRQITDILKILIDNQDNRKIEKVRQALAKLEESNPAPVD